MLPARLRGRCDSPGEVEMTIFKAILGKPSRSNGLAGVSTLAFLVLLGAALAGAQAPAGSDADDSGKLEWGPEQDGLRTGLSAINEEFYLGKPISFRLDVKNVGHRTVEFAAEQFHLRASMSIERSDGMNVPYIKSLPQTGFGDDVVLKPGQRTVLVDGLDIADWYLLTSPGTYTIQFGGGDGHYPDVVEDGRDPASNVPTIRGAGIPASNVLTIRVADGPVRPSRSLTRKLLDAVQASGLRLEIDEEGDVVPLGRSSVSGTALAVIRDGRYMAFGENRRAQIWVTASASAIVQPKPGEKYLSPAEAIGHCAWGEVYLWSAVASEEELIRRLTVAALKIDERLPG